MNLLTTQYVHDKQRLEIYLAGCKGDNGVHCAGCHNPQSWDFNAGKIIDLDKLAKKIEEPIVKNVWILGGEPLDQPRDELIYILFELMLLHKPLWLFTRFDFDEVDITIRCFLKYLKTGKYDVTKACDDNIREGVALATSNQKLWKKIDGMWREVEKDERVQS